MQPTIHPTTVFKTNNLENRAIHNLADSRRSPFTALARIRNMPGIPLFWSIFARVMEDSMGSHSKERHADDTLGERGEEQHSFSSKLTHFQIVFLTRNLPSQTTPICFHGF